MLFFRTAAALLIPSNKSAARLFVVARQLSAMAAPTTVSCPSQNKAGPCPALLSGDPKKTSKGLVVIQEWWGMNQQIQDCGKELADGGSGYVTLVPDLYRGKIATDNETAGHYMGELDWPGAVQDIAACVKYLKETQGCKKVAVTGFCMGGALSLAAAALIPEVDAAAPFYGIPSKELCDVSKITIPLQCHFAEKDSVAGFSSPNEWKPLKDTLEKNLKVLEFHTYDTDHAFTNKSGPNYNEKACKLAFSRMFQFFDKHLA